jgi:hypothetical protein
MISMYQKTILAACCKIEIHIVLLMVPKIIIPELRTDLLQIQQAIHLTGSQVSIYCWISILKWNQMPSYNVYLLRAEFLLNQLTL